MAYCTYCGATIENENDKDCQYCGNPIQREPQPVQQYTNNQYNNQYGNPYQNNPYNNPYGNPFNPLQNNAYNLYYKDSEALEKAKNCKTLGIIALIFNPLLMFSIIAIIYGNQASSLAPTNQTVESSVKTGKTCAIIAIILNIIYIVNSFAIGVMMATM